MITVRPCGITVARVGVARLHRHHRPPVSGLVAFEVLDAGGWPRGWAVVGRPVSRVLDAAGWVEVTRVATDGTRNACSALYGACARWAWAQRRPCLTYTLSSEPGTSLRAAGWSPVHRTRAGRWSNAGRPRQAARPEQHDKIRWSPRRDFIGPELPPSWIGAQRSGG